MGGVYDAVAGFRANKYHGVDFSIRQKSGVIGIMETGAPVRQRARPGYSVRRAF